MFEMDVEFARGILFVTLIGKLTEETINSFKEQVLKLINKSGINNLVINMDGIEKVDDKVLEEIKKLKELLKGDGGNLKMHNMPLNINDACLLKF